MYTNTPTFAHMNEGANVHYKKNDLSPLRFTKVSVSAPYPFFIHTTQRVTYVTLNIGCFHYSVLDKEKFRLKMSFLVKHSKEEL